MAFSLRAAPWPTLQAVRVYDVLGNKAAGTATGSYAAAVPSHDVAFVIFEPAAGSAPLHTEQAFAPAADVDVGPDRR